MKLYNTLTRKKEDFKPADPKKVGVYICGITAYDSSHLGHARGAINFDVVVRYLRFKGFDVTFVKNFTDVDDKIIKKANDEGVTCSEITEKYIAEYKRDMESLGNIAPDIEPKATEHITEMIETVKKLIDNGLAYERNGDVFFAVRKFKKYGQLSGKKIDELESGARIDVNEAKDDPLDFALWKASKPNEPKWPSPWGEGRPGWHIECSAMSSKYLGQPFDIHGGGRDLIFPHHENEIAQAEGAEGKKFVNCWLHNGFININAEKMSKSLGNFTTTKAILDHHGGEAVRYFIISNHYRSPLDYTEAAMDDATSALDRFYETARRVGNTNGDAHEASPATADEKALSAAMETSEKNFFEFMDDDFNTAGAIGSVFEVVRAVNRYLDTAPDQDSDFYKWFAGRWAYLRNIWGNVLGLFNTAPEEYFEKKKNLTRSAAGIDADEVERLLLERKNARAKKDFKRADEIRVELDKKGIVIKDRPDGTTEWQVK